MKYFNYNIVQVISTALTTDGDVSVFDKKGEKGRRPALQQGGWNPNVLVTERKAAEVL